MTKEIAKAIVLSEKEDYQKRLAWIKYRLHALDVIEDKLQHMKELAKLVKTESLSPLELNNINAEFKNTEKEVNELDEKSRNFQLFYN